MANDLLKAAVLGIVEGLTEFIPVSSTGHLLLMQHFFGFDDENFGKTFAILIQLGAILAILSVYFTRLTQIALGFFSDRQERRFVLGILFAFLPAAAIGAAAHGFIKGVLFNPWIVCVMLIIGGLLLMWVDRFRFKPRYNDVTQFSFPLYLGIGAFQCLAMIPGVSRSGATILGAMLLGTDKRSAAEFSFWLAMPTMAGAFTYDLYKSYAQLSLDNTLLIAMGFASSFVCALLVVKTLLGFVTRHGFMLFAWWRVIIGTLGLFGLLAGWTFK